MKYILEYLKGEWFCRFFHKPLLFRWAGCGGSDVLNRRRKSYYNYACVKCDVQWESERKPKWYKLPQEERFIISEKLKNKE